MEAKLKSGLWVKAHIRNCDIALISIFVLQKGDEDAGAVLIKVHRGLGNCRVFTQSRDLDGRLVWSAGTGDAPVDESKADEYIARQRKYDPDVWILEVEDTRGDYHPGQFG